MKNETSVLDEILEKIKNIDSKEFIEYLREINEKEKKGIEYVGKKEYFDWLTNSFLKKFKDRIYDSESFLYRDKSKFSKEEEEKESKICWIDNFLEIVRKKQRAQKDEDFFPFEGVRYYFKFNGEMYMYSTMIGQGSVTTIRKADNDEIFTKNINLDKYFKENH